MERRLLTTTHLEVRQNGRGPVLAGYVVKFDKLSQQLYGFREKVRKGAFAKSLRSGRVVKALWNHNSGLVLASTGNKTLRLWEDGQGLRFEADPPDTSWGKDAVASIKRGDVDGVSFGFTTIKDEWDSSDPKNVIRTLVEVDLFEVSPVAFPAYEGASSVGVRSAQTVWEEYRAKQEAARSVASAKQNRDRIQQLENLTKELGIVGIVEFRNLGEFVAAARWNADELRQQNVTVGAAGGFLVPADQRKELLRVSPEDAIVRPRALVLEPGEENPDAPLENLPMLDQRNTGYFSNMTFAWTAEGGPKPLTAIDYAALNLEPKEICGHIVVTDKLLRNTKANSNYFNVLLRGGLAEAEDAAFLTGNGAAGPLGVINCPGRIDVPRTGFPSAAPGDNYTDLLSMIGALVPSSLERAMFVANPDLFGEIYSTTDANGNLVLKPGEGGRRWTLMGFPIAFSSALPAPGQRGDLCLVDLRYYVIKDGSGPFIAASAETQALFLRNQTVVKIFGNTDGAGMLAAPMLINGVQKSPFVILQ